MKAVCGLVAIVELWQDNLVSSDVIKMSTHVAVLPLEGPWVTEADFACLANSRPIVLDCSFVSLFVLAALNLSCKLSCRLYSVEYSLIPRLLIAVNKAHEYDSGVSTEFPKAKHAVEGARHVIATRSVLRDTLEWLILMLMSTSWTAYLYVP
jgi:hypothetical protein